MTSRLAHAKLNLALVVGPTRQDGLHELATIYQRLELCDELRLEPAESLSVEGFEDDTLIRVALERFAAAAGIEPAWHAQIEKRIPVAAGLGGGSSDAAAALLLASELAGDPLSSEALHELARGLGADVPFFLSPGPKLGIGEGAVLEPLDLPQDYTVLLLLPRDEAKSSTGEVYGRFQGEAGFLDRRARLLEIAAKGSAADLSALPLNDLATSTHAGTLSRLGAFRADVSGAGPTVYGLFRERAAAEQARDAIESLGRCWITTPAW